MVSKGVPELRLAAGHADALLRERGVDRFPVDPMAIAEANGIVVKAMDDPGCSGMLMHRGGAFGIMYSTAVDSPGFQRFSVAHELGHYFLPGHHEAVLREGEHRSSAGFVATDPYEREADQFAAELLLPERLARPFLRRLEDGLPSVQGLSREAIASLPASGIAYARYARSAVAVIMSSGGRVDFCTFSDPLKDARVGWLKKGDPIPRTSASAEMDRSPARILAADVDGRDGRLSEWFNTPRDLAIVEEVVGLGRYGKLLTVLHCPALSAAADGLEVEDEEEDELIERWTPRFHR